MEDFNRRKVRIVTKEELRSPEPLFKPGFTFMNNQGVNITLKKIESSQPFGVRWVCNLEFAGMNAECFYNESTIMVDLGKWWYNQIDGNTYEYNN